MLHYFPAECPAAPRFTLGLTNLSVFSGGVAEFLSVVVGYPAPTLRWLYSSNSLPGKTNATLMLSPATSTNAGTYSIIASNASGTATSTATLIVRPRPDLRITEVQSAQSTGGTKGDWWELTSFETQPVNLFAWRFNDSDGGLNDAFIIGALTIAPGESIVFVEGLTATQFSSWWGTTNLPTGLKVITYTGPGLGFGAGGDTVWLWNDTVTDTNDFIARATFGSATTGVSFNYDPGSGVFGALSVPGVHGVVRAAVGNDLGSPGRILAPLVAPVLQISRTNARVRIAFEAMGGRSYMLEGRNDFEDATWDPTGETFTATNNAPAFFEKDVTTGRRFFRVQAQ
jgi:hypothetical protein